MKHVALCLRFLYAVTLLLHSFSYIFLIFFSQSSSFRRSILIDPQIAVGRGIWTPGLCSQRKINFGIFSKKKCNSSLRWTITINILQYLNCNLNGGQKRNLGNIVQTQRNQLRIFILHNILVKEYLINKICYVTRSTTTTNMKMKVIAHKELKSLSKNFSS